ncbi:hypothetical protein AWC15_20405 [Mycobacterium lacus]|nr:hypothetical protein AWC15_20405 [Mycobacterium lacus]
MSHFHYFWQDKLIDEASADAIMCLIASEALSASLDLLCDIDPNNSRLYRVLHTKYYARYVAAIIRDLKHRGVPKKYTPAEVLGLGDKAASLMLPLQLVGNLAGKTSSIERIIEVFIRFSTGFQLIDDLADAEEDASEGNLTWPLTVAVEVYPEISLADAESVRAAIVGSGVDRASLALAHRVFSHVRDEASRLGAQCLSDLGSVWVKRAASQLTAAEANFARILGDRPLKSTGN